MNEEVVKNNCQLGENSLCQAACACPRRAEVSWGAPGSLKGARASCVRRFGPAPGGHGEHLGALYCLHQEHAHGENRDVEMQIGLHSVAQGRETL